MKRWLLTLFIAAIHECCRADAFIVAPTPGPVGGPTDTATPIPFLTRMITVSPFPSLRYHQVYNASVFTNVDPALIYITTLTFFLDDFGTGSFPWTITDMQINLSTTQRGADNLSTSFSENVGADDTVVFGPGRNDFQGGGVHARLQVLLDRPFRYNPTSGNLLLDVRIFNGTGPPDMFNPQLNAYNSSTDECSRVWATNVTDAVASGTDTTGLDTVIQFSAVPSLVIYRTSEQGTNVIVVKWPAQPSAFVLQSSVSLGAGALWQPITNYDRATSTNTLVVPVSSLDKTGFYQLIWESGQPIQPAAVSVLPEARRESPQMK